jgi:hypothetical protein
MAILGWDEGGGDGVGGGGVERRNMKAAPAKLDCICYSFLLLDACFLFLNCLFFLRSDA